MMIDLEKLKKHQHLVIMPHVSPDGDAIGSCVAFYLGLKQLGIFSTIISDDILPEDIAFIAKNYLSSTEDFLAKKCDYDACILLDMSSTERLGKRIDLISNKIIYNIDHHKTNTHYGNFNVVDIKAAATGEIIYKLLKKLGVVINHDIAEALFVAIITDTGAFKYANTTADTMRIVADLIETGFDRENAVNHIYHSIPKQKINLHAACISKTQFFNDEKIALCIVSRQDLKIYSANQTYTEGLVERVRDIKGVQMVILLKEVADNNIKVSMRSIGDFDVAIIANAHGGGGHINAAGFTIKKSLYEAIDYTKNAIIAKVTL